jgi:uroporphyrinogen-III synthase
MRVLVTRPEEDALSFGERLKARGHEAIVAPLMRVHFHNGPDIPLDGVQAILATSANGIRGLARRTRRRNVPVFAVGPQTEREARKLGFSSVRNADGDARALLEATKRWARPAAGTLLHVRGAESSRELETLLCHEGFDVRGEILYEVAAETALPANAIARLRADSIDAALFFSPRSARIFRELCATAHLDTRRLVAACISRATADALSPLSFRDVLIAAKPNQDALLALLDTSQ